MQNRLVNQNCNAVFVQVYTLLPLKFLDQASNFSSYVNYMCIIYSYVFVYVQRKLSTLTSIIPCMEYCALLSVLLHLPTLPQPPGPTCATLPSNLLVSTENSFQVLTSLADLDRTVVAAIEFSMMSSGVVTHRVTFREGATLPVKVTFIGLQPSTVYGVQMYDMGDGGVCHITQEENMSGN